jgi:hypothetical protein
MQTENNTSKLADSPQQEAGEGCSKATCSADLDDWKERLMTYRKENFAVTTAAPRKDGDTVTLSITTNGDQWQVIGLMPDEIQRVIDALIPFLPNANVDLPDTAAQDSTSKSNSPAVSG